MTARDMFALGGPQDADAEILALFRQWLAQSRIADGKEGNDPAWGEALDRRDKLEDQIVALPAGPIGLAIKAYLHYRVEASGWTPTIAEIRDTTLFEAGGLDAVGRLMVSILQDAAALVPEIGELAAAVIHEDALLIDADMTIQWAALVPRDDAERAELLRTTLARIASTPAKTPRGEAIKARHASRLD